MFRGEPRRRDEHAARAAGQVNDLEGKEGGLLVLRAAAIAFIGGSSGGKSSIESST